VVGAAVHVRRHLQVVALHAGAVAACVLLEDVPRPLVLRVVGGALLEVEAVAAPHGLRAVAGVAAAGSGGECERRDPVLGGVVDRRQAQRPQPVLRGPYRGVDGVEQPPRVLRGDAVQRLVPAGERVGPALAHPGELGLPLAEPGLEVRPVRVPRARLGAERAVPGQHALPRLPHVRRRPPRRRRARRRRRRARRAPPPSSRAPSSACRTCRPAPGGSGSAPWRPCGAPSHCSSSSISSPPSLRAS